MTVDEIKAKYSMQDIAEMYGIKKNRAGFVSCPFHGKDNHPSMKLYKSDYHCYTCNANGDIFTFIQHMEGCSFKDAFFKLGGTYDKKTDYQHRLFQHRLLQKQQQEEQKERNNRLRIKQLSKDMELQRLFIKCFPVFSDDWSDAVNNFENDYQKLENIQLRGSENNY